LPLVQGTVTCRALGASRPARTIGAVERLERLLNLIATLLAAERPLRAEEVRDRVPGYPDGDVAFHRAFSRDKATLRAMDIPLDTIVLDPGDPEAGVGYRIPKQRYELPDPGLEPAEVAALHLASTAVRLDGDAATQAIWKLGGVRPGEAPSPPGPGTASLPGSEHLAVLFGAASAGTTVRFEYRDTTRTVDPWQISFRNGFWYLAGWDHDREERRSFRLDRFRGPPEVVGPAASIRPAGSSEPTRPWEMGDEDAVTVEVLVDADQARWAVATAGHGAVVRQGEDGSVVLRLVVTNRAALRSFVLGLLDHAEVLEPGDVRTDLVAWVRAGAEVWT
jgi:proteasome accessory factor B